MSDSARCGARKRPRRRLRGFPVSISLGVAALTLAAWLAVPDPGNEVGSRAVAAEVNAMGAPAPVGFADIAAKVKPAVVGVRVKLKQPGSSDGMQQLPFPPGSPFNRFFRRFGFPFSGTPSERYEEALGSGFFISSDGYIVTNNHVVAHGRSFEVTTSEGKTYPAKVVGTDPRTDLALLKVKGNDFPYVTFAPKEPRVGDWVLAIGNPFGLGGTVTAGIVSARGRDIGAGPYEDFIQIDAPVNKGNSGGPTFNVQGQVVGVNTSILTPSGGFVGVAFDIPAATVKLVIQQLEKTGHVERGWLGVQIQRVTPAIADALGLKTAAGALVAELEPNSPASKAGIETGDVISSVNGEKVTSSRDLARKIAAIAPGTSVKLGVFRHGKERTISVTLGTLPSTSQARAEERTAPSPESRLGLTLAPARTVPGAGEHGVVVTGVNPNGRAAQSGLQNGDVILAVNGETVDTPADVRRIVAEARAQSKHAILLRIKRGNETSFVGVRIG